MDDEIKKRVPDSLVITFVAADGTNLCVDVGATCRRAIHAFPFEAHIHKTHEELAELQLALSRWWLNKGAPEDVLDEAVDSIIVSLKIAMIVIDGMGEHVSPLVEHIARKLARLQIQCEEVEMKREERARGVL